ncbi:MAG: hypothetical protein J0L73_03920, partial [Verrucomicrobia bacterium]|nr:hypothetical protein [Verrucomicrobiota bacterium]
SKELRAARESGLGALVFNRLWELRHTNTRRIFNHPGMHQHFIWEAPFGKSVIRGSAPPHPILPSASSLSPHRISASRQHPSHSPSPASLPK